MQIPKFSLWICALAVGGAMTLHAEDSPAQAAARAALLQKMQELAASVPSTRPISAQTGDTPAQAAARTALEQKMSEIGSELPAAPQTPPPVATTPIAKPAAPEPVVKDVPAPAAQPVDAQTGDTPAQAAARTALAQKFGIKETLAVARPKPIVAPPLPISMSKEEKLQWLLSRYKADQISPEQYHDQRAAILAAP